MAYEDVANLATDDEFNARLAACVQTEAKGLSDGLSDLILKNMMFYGATVFIGPVSTSPGFDTKYAAGGQEAITDGDLLSSVQANWARLAGLYVDAPA
jgi:hypothetical protein